MEEFLSMLREKGFAASRTHFNGTSFKTDADILQIGQIIKSIK
jgi:tRNA (guanine26-N2/guanine27-N2)-dimethyltransferase